MEIDVYDVVRLLLTDELDVEALRNWHLEVQVTWYAKNKSELYRLIVQLH